MVKNPNITKNTTKIFVFLSILPPLLTNYIPELKKYFKNMKFMFFNEEIIFIVTDNVVEITFPDFVRNSM